MDWTFTSAGLPAENARVLAWVVPPELGADVWADLKGDIRILTRSGDDWFSDDGDTDFDAQDVYAWMPLPEPPKAGMIGDLQQVCRPNAKVVQRNEK